MVDAYEIGIQLSLQDDVSAGLQVIRRELAEIDKAIATTSANYAKLAQVGAGSVAQVSVAAVSGSKAIAGRSPAVASEESAAAPQSSQGKGQGAVVNPDADRFPAPLPKAEITKDFPQAVRQEVATVPVAPVERAADDGANLQDARVDSTVQGPARAEPTIAIEQNLQSVAPTTDMPLAGSLAETRGGADVSNSGSPDTPPVVHHSYTVQHQNPVRTVAPAPAAPQVTASVMSAIAPMEPVLRASNDSSSGTGAVGHQYASSAPWLGLDQKQLAAQSGHAMQPAAAPAAESKDRNDAMSGTVMLDGQLVGYWLSEHMAREASRPPGGTSFFDPRQTPAWTASGSL